MSSRTEASRAASLVGQEIDGRYRVDSVLARGGMGVVLRGTHLVLGQPVAIKVMLDATTRDPNLRERFLREARILAQVRAPAIASIFDAGQLADGSLYLVMELLEGEDLETMLVRGTVPLELATKILAQVCEGLAEAHEQGIVHRDLKPANIFVVQKPNGEKAAKIIDFGISKRLGDTSEATGVNTLVGSPYYMAPEQIYASRDLDPRADIWSLGVILYRLLVGAQPFEAPSLVGILTRIKTASPTFPETLDPALVEVLRRCLEKDRAKRFATARDLRDALTPFATPRESDGVSPSRRDVAPHAPHASVASVASLPGLPSPPRSGTLGPISRASKPAFPVGPARFEASRVDALSDHGATTEWRVPEAITSEVSTIDPDDLVDVGEVSGVAPIGESTLPDTPHASQVVPVAESVDAPADQKKTVVRLAPHLSDPQRLAAALAPPIAPHRAPARPIPAQAPLPKHEGKDGWHPVWEENAQAPSSVAPPPVARRPVPVGPLVVGTSVAVAVLAIIVLAAQCGAPPPPSPVAPTSGALSSRPLASAPVLVVLSPPPPDEVPDASDAGPHTK